MSGGPGPRSHRRVATAMAVVGVALIVLSACAAVPDEAARVAEPATAGFWLGLWQGLITPITFLISLFSDRVAIYAVHNNGNWYDFGYVLGVALVFSGPARIGSGGRRKARARSG